MAVIRLEDVAPGMVLEKPIVIQGRVLLAAGAAVGAKHIQLLKAWGVNAICVPDATPAVAAPEDAWILSEDEKNAVIERVMRRFEAYDEHQDVWVEIRRLVIERALQQVLAAKRAAATAAPARSER